MNWLLGGLLKRINAQHESLMEKSQFKKEIAHYELAFRRTAKKN